MYEEAIRTVMTVRDFTQVFDSYAQFEESMIAAKMETASELGREEEGELLGGLGWWGEWVWVAYRGQGNPKGLGERGRGVFPSYSGWQGTGAGGKCGVRLALGQPRLGPAGGNAGWIVG